MNAIHTAALTMALAINVYSQINLKANDITFRENSNASKYTTHYGDLYLEGGSAGANWGWLAANRIDAGYSLFEDDLTVIGNFDVYGSKNFVHPHPSNPSREIRYSALESGEAITLVRGLAKTSNGEAHISLPEHFSLVTSGQGPITVLLTCENVPAVIYVKAKSKSRVSVGIKPSDYAEYGDVSFAYEVKGIRDGFEDMEPISNVGSAPPVSERRAEYNARVKTIAEKHQEMRRSKKMSK